MFIVAREVDTGTYPVNELYACFSSLDLAMKIEVGHDIFEVRPDGLYRVAYRYISVQAWTTDDDRFYSIDEDPTR